jgi:hypothetical protein
MALSVAHMSIEIVKQEQRDIMAQRANTRVQELQAARNVILRKKNAALIEFFFAFQLFLAAAFVTAMYYA